MKTNRIFNNSFSVRVNKGDVCKLENNDNGCITTSIALVLAQTNNYFTYLCINNLRKEVINDELNVPITEEDFKQLCDKHLFDKDVKFMHVSINQIKTNRNMIITEVSGTLQDSLLDIIESKLLYYLGIKNKTLKNENEQKEFIQENNFVKNDKVLRLSAEQKDDLINNYCASRKEYYAKKYNIPVDKIAQKVASLKFQRKKKLQNGRI